MKSKKQRKISRKSLIKQLDALTRQICIIRDDSTCQWCGAKVQGVYAQCSHVRTRKYYDTRWEQSNVKILCPACHRRWHDNPVEADAWFNEKFPERRKWILERQKMAPHTWRDEDLLKIKRELEEKLHELEKEL